MYWNSPAYKNAFLFFVITNSNECFKSHVPFFQGGRTMCDLQEVGTNSVLHFLTSSFYTAACFNLKERSCYSGYFVPSVPAGAALRCCGWLTKIISRGPCRPLREEHPVVAESQRGCPASLNQLWLESGPESKKLLFSLSHVVSNPPKNGTHHHIITGITSALP